MKKKKDKSEIFWLINNNFDKEPNGLGMVQFVQYTANIDHYPTIIDVFGNDKRITINVHTNKPLHKRINQHLLDNNCIVEAKNIDFNKTGLELPITEKKQFTAFLNTIQQFLPIASIKKDILDTIGVKAIIDETAFYNELKLLIEDQKINVALQKIENVEDEHVSLKLGILFEEYEKYSEAMELYQEIPPENPNYSEANNRAADILFHYVRSCPSMEQEEQMKHLKSIIRFMLRAGNEENQQLLDRRFSELCASKFSTPLISDVKVDENTLLALASHTASLAKKIEILEKKVRSFEQQDLQNSPAFFQSAPKQVSSKENNDDEEAIIILENFIRYF